MTFLKQLFFFLLFVAYLPTINSQAIVTGFNYDSSDGFAVVALEDLPSSTLLFITETDYDPNNNDFNRDNTNDGTWQITWTGTWLKGTLIRFEEISNNAWTATSSLNGPANPAATSPYGDAISLSNEGLSIFSASSTTDPDNNVDEIFSFVIHDGASVDPNPGSDGNCPCSTNFISVDLQSSTTDHGNFMDGLRSNIVTNSILTDIGNWSVSANNNPLSLVEFSNISLPVELINFHAVLQKGEKGTLLEWTTASEENNLGFQVQRSRDGRIWEDLDFIRGQGTVEIRQQYFYVDDAPHLGNNYYRLKQIDLDGRVFYSNVAAISFLNENKLVEVFPNPSRGQFNIQIQSSISENVSIKIMDAKGSMVLSNNYALNEIELIDERQFNLVEQGVYFVIIQVGEKIATEKITVLR